MIKPLPLIGFTLSSGEVKSWFFNFWGIGIMEKMERWDPHGFRKRSLRMTPVAPGGILTSHKTLLRMTEWVN